MVDWERIKTDILVVGGAITGLQAAIRAKQVGADLEVLVVDKGKAGRSGCANWGGGDFTFVIPEDDLDDLMARYIKGGDGLAEPDWLRFALTETYPRVMEMVSWGVPFERDAQERLVRKGGRGGGALSAVCRGSEILRVLREVAKSYGVKFLDKAMVTEILLGNDGSFAGAVAFVVGRDPVSPLVIQGRACILAAGPCSFKAAYIGHRMATGDGLAMAIKHGAEAVGMEFGVDHNTGPRNFDIAGMARFVGMGGRFS